MPKTRETIISIVGMGYVGLVTGLCFSEKGYHVVGVDVDHDKVELINSGKTPFYEKGTMDLLEKHLNQCFFVTTDLEAAVKTSDITFITVGTPFDGKKIDLSFIKQAALQIGSALRSKEDYHLIVVKSTVTPGTTDDIVRLAIEKNSHKRLGKDFGLCMNPEFLREGQAIFDFLNPDRIVIGGTDSKSCDWLETIYRPFIGSNIIKTSNKTAELIKYVSNCLFATMISFGNEIANICSIVKETDVMDVMQGVFLDRRISVSPSQETVQPGFVQYLKPGCGFGGSCFPKDVNALVAYAKERNISTLLLDAVLKVNSYQPLQMLRYLKKYYPVVMGVHVGVLGLSFKPDTDDIRCSPALIAIQALKSEGAVLYAYDPIVKRLDNEIFQGVYWLENIEDMVNKVEAILIFTAWEEFKQLPTIVEQKKKQLIIIDGRRIINKQEIVNYDGIGIG